jgi:hypothetical protein
VQAVPWLQAQLAEPDLTADERRIVWNRFFSFELRGFLITVLGMTQEQTYTLGFFPPEDDVARN